MNDFTNLALWTRIIIDTAWELNLCRDGGSRNCRNQLDTTCCRCNVSKSWKILRIGKYFLENSKFKLVEYLINVTVFLYSQGLHCLLRPRDKLPRWSQKVRATFHLTTLPLLQQVPRHRPNRERRSRITAAGRQRRPQRPVAQLCFLAMFLRNFRRNVLTKQLFELMVLESALAAVRVIPDNFSVFCGCPTVTLVILLRIRPVTRVLFFSVLDISETNCRSGKSNDWVLVTATNHAYF